MSRPITMSTETSDKKEEQPSMIGAHLKYAQGAASSALGYETGETTKQEALKEMREANEQSGPPTQSTVLGSIENVAGKVTGCEGMENEGKSRAGGAVGSEEASGTG